MKKKYSISTLMALLLLAVFVYRLYDYGIHKNYIVSVYADCNPVQYSCFKLDDPGAGYGFENGPYEKVTITQRVAPACLQEHTCSNFTCDGITGGTCEVLYCSSEVAEESESCTSFLQ